MRKQFRAFLSLALLCLLIAAGVSPAVAQDDTGAPDEAAMMAAYAAASTPGEPHERLASSVGTWNMEVKMWMGPGEPSVSEGTAKRYMILGDRILVEEVSASMMGEAFKGYGMTGYDNVTDTYWGTWNDSMTTGISVSHGTFDAETSTYTFLGDSHDPMTGEVIKNRGVIHLKDGREVMEYFETRDGHETKTMEIVYTRK